ATTTAATWSAACHAGPAHRASARPPSTANELRASRRWSHATASTALEPVFWATRVLYWYRPSFRTALAAAMASVYHAGGSDGAPGGRMASQPMPRADRIRSRATLEPATDSARVCP